MKRSQLMALALALGALGVAAVSCGTDPDGGDVDDDALVESADQGLSTQYVSPFSVIIASDPQFWWSQYNVTEGIDDDAGCTEGAWDNSGLDGDDDVELGDLTNRRQVSAMLQLAGRARPPFMSPPSQLPAGFSQRPSQVIINGDLTEYGRHDQWNAYHELYTGLLGSVLDVYPGLGNHDYDNNVRRGDKGGCQCNLLEQPCTNENSYMLDQDYCAKYGIREIRDWATGHRDQLHAVHSGSLAYSWVKSGIKFIQLHNYAAYEEPSIDITSSLSWLKDELADAVALRQRVVLNMHDFDDSAADDEFVEALDGFEHNVIGIFSGHRHERAGYWAAVEVNGIPIPHFYTGSATWNLFLLAEFDNTGMKVTVINAATGSPIEETLTPEEVDAGVKILDNPLTPAGCYDARVGPRYEEDYPTHGCREGLVPTVSGCTSECTCVQDEARIIDADIKGQAEGDDELGRALATGDFDGDGFLDLAIGVPNEDVGGENDPGAVNVVYGSVYGLSKAREQIWTQDSSNVPDDAEGDDRFGHALATGDFNGDGKDDLAIGAPGEDQGSNDAGAVFVLFGSPAGLRAPSSASLGDPPLATMLYQCQNPSTGCEPQDEFGWALAAGDFDHDGRDDLAIGVPHEDLKSGTANDAGMVHVLFGRSFGLPMSSANAMTIDQDSPGVDGMVEADDQFGRALAAGDVNGDGFDELLVGAPTEDVGSVNDAGMMHVLWGSSVGPVGILQLGASPWVLVDPGITQNAGSVAGECQPGDEFGKAIAVGDFNADGRADVAVGTPHEDTSSGNDVGTVHLFKGGASGLVTSSDPGLNPAKANVCGEPSANARFGAALAAADLDADGRDELLIGVPYEDLPGGNDGGMITSVRVSTSSSVWSAAGSGCFHQGVAFTPGSVDADDRFGSALAAGDFDRDGKADVAIGVPGEDITKFRAVSGDGIPDTHDDAGMVNVLYGSSTSAGRLTTLRSQSWDQGI